jgi:hypothetical protein
MLEIEGKLSLFLQTLVMAKDICMYKELIFQDVRKLLEINIILMCNAASDGSDSTC